MSYLPLLSVLCVFSMLGASSAAAGQAPQREAAPQPSARLVLAADVDGRFYVRNAAQELVAEVYKPAGRTMTLNVEPGSYQVRVEREKTAMQATITVVDGGEVVLDSRQLGAVTVETSPPAYGELMTYAVTSRNRFDFRFGAWGHGDHDQIVTDGLDWGGVLGGIRYTRYFKESLAATFSIEGGGSVGTIAGANGLYDRVSGLVMFPVGVRWNPLTFGRQHDGIKPFLAASAGPVFGDMVTEFDGRRRYGNDIRSTATMGGFLGGGADFHAGRTCVVGVEAGYNWMGDFDVPIGGSNNYSGPTVSVNLGFMWGRGSTPRP